MKIYKKNFFRYWMNTDEKPKGKMKRVLQQQTRAQLRVASKKEIKEVLKRD